jgi:mono/diheme cytochrome c family protein
MEAQIKNRQLLVLSSVVVLNLAFSAGAAAQNGEAPLGKFYRLVDGMVDQRTYNGFRRYHGGCNHCHGPDGMGSTIGPALVAGLGDIAAFRRIVRDGQSTGTSVMKGFADDPNIAPYIDDIYAYLQARNDGVLGRGRPIKLRDREGVGSHGRAVGANPKCEHFGDKDCSND